MLFGKVKRFNCFHNRTRVIRRVSTKSPAVGEKIDVGSDGSLAAAGKPDTSKPRKG